MRKQLAIGIDDFRRIREEDYFYIDKTLLIRDFLTYKKYVSLITRPRRFGKTLNMTMMREFFDISKDSKSIFKGLDIMNTEFAKQMNTVPVIYLTFKNCSGNTPEALRESLAKAIWEEYMRYAGLFGNTVDKEDDHYYKFYITYHKLREESITDSVLESSLSRLMRAAYAFYGKRPIVLIDEYDHPLIKSYEKGFYDKFSDLYTNFLGEALKGNEFLGQALLTGIQQIAKESIFSELNNFLVYTSLSKQYAAYFGMQKNEVKKMLSYYRMSLTDDLATFYNGYVFGGLEIYNPWSLLSYLDAGTLKPYWRNTSTNTLVRSLIKDADQDFMSAFERLLVAGEVKVPVNLEASLQEQSSPRVLWGMFVNTGYLTITRESTHGMSILRIPNLEAKEEIRRMIAAYTRLSNEKLSNLFVASITNDINAFVRVLQHLVCEYDGIYDFNEDNYAMLFLGMSASVTGLYRFLHYPQLGSTVSGFALQSMHPDLRPSILVEMRKGDDVENLKQDALAEILHGKYYGGLEGKVLCVGLARSERTCEIAVKRIHNADANIDFPAPRVVTPPIVIRPPKVEAPRAEAKKVEDHKVEDHKVEVHKVEVPTGEAPKVEAPTVEAPKTEAPTIEAPSAEVPTGEAPSAEAPKVEAPSAEVPKVEAPKAEVPKVEAPKAEVPSAEASKAEVTKAEAPTGEAPSAEVPKVEAPKAEVTSDEAPTAKVPSAETPTGEAPKSEVPTKPSAAPETEVLPKVAESPQALESIKAGKTSENEVPAKIATPPKETEPLSNVTPAKETETPKTIEPDEVLDTIPKSKAAVIELAPPPEPTTLTKTPQVADSTRDTKGAPPTEVTPVVKKPQVTEPAKDAKKPQAAEPTKDGKTSQAAEPAKDAKKPQAAEPAKDAKKPHAAESVKDSKTSKKQAESTKNVPATEPTKTESEATKSTSSPPKKKNKEAKNNNVKQNEALKKKTKKPSFLKVLLVNIHIILAILFLFGAIFFAVTNFRANRPPSGVAIEYQVNATLLIEQENEIYHSIC